MVKNHKRIYLVAAALIGLGLTTAGTAFAGESRYGRQKTSSFESPVQTKQMVEGLYSQDFEAAAYFQQGVTRYNRGDYRGAELALRKALEFDSSIAMAYYLLGNSLAEQGQPEKATNEYLQALRLDPNL